MVTSAGALIDGLHHLEAKRIALIAPYMKPLTEMVVAYIEAEGVTVRDYLALEIADNLVVGEQDPLALVEHVKRIDTSGVDAIVLSACVQMPSLAAIQIVEDALGVPVISSAVATAWQMLKALDLEPIVPDAGALLSGTQLGPAVIRRDHFSKEMGSLAGYSAMSSLRRIWWLATSPAAERGCSVVLDVLSNVRPGCMCAFLLRGPQPRQRITRVVSLTSDLGSSC